MSNEERQRILREAGPAPGETETQAVHTAEERRFPAIADAFAAGVVVGWIIKRR